MPNLSVERYPWEEVTRNLFAFCIAGLLAASMSVSAGGEEGVAAYKRGDYATALKVWRPLAENGDAEAQYGLGLMYGNGQGVPKDYAEAEKWFRKASEDEIEPLGHAGARFALGLMYERGQGVPKDDAEAARWFRRAAESAEQHAPAQVRLGLMYKTRPRRAEE